jgi:hypothetical protein
VKITCSVINQSLEREWSSWTISYKLKLQCLVSSVLCWEDTHCYFISFNSAMGKKLWYQVCYLWQRTVLCLLEYVTRVIWQCAAFQTFANHLVFLYFAEAATALSSPHFLNRILCLTCSNLTFSVHVLLVRVLFKWIYCPCILRILLNGFITDNFSFPLLGK